jgi:hypothetical protein
MVSMLGRSSLLVLLLVVAVVVAIFAHLVLQWQHRRRHRRRRRNHGNSSCVTHWFRRRLEKNHTRRGHIIKVWFTFWIAGCFEAGPLDFCTNHALCEIMFSSQEQFVVISSCIRPFSSLSRGHRNAKR